MTCANRDDWIRVLTRYMTDEPARREAGEGGHAFVRREHTDATLIASWDAVFASLQQPTLRIST